MKYTFGFIGCGNMGGALAKAVAKSDADVALLLCDACAERAETKALALGATANAMQTVVRESVKKYILDLVVTQNIKKSPFQDHLSGRKVS